MSTSNIMAEFEEWDKTKQATQEPPPIYETNAMDEFSAWDKSQDVKLDRPTNVLSEFEGQEVTQTQEDVPPKTPQTGIDIPLPQFETAIPGTTLANTGYIPTKQELPGMSPARALGVTKGEVGTTPLQKKQIPTRPHRESTMAGGLVTGLEKSIPFFGAKGQDIEQIEQEQRGQVIAGEILGTVAQGALGASGVSRILAKTAISKSPILMNALSRTIPAIVQRGAMSTEEVIEGTKDIETALFDSIIESGGGAAFSMIPEIIMPAGLAQIIAQPLADLVYQAGIDAVRGSESREKVFTKEWFMEQIPTLATSMGFAIKDVADGKLFIAQQKAMREEIKGILPKPKPDVETPQPVEIVDGSIPKTSIDEFKQYEKEHPELDQKTDIEQQEQVVSGLPTEDIKPQQKIDELEKRPPAEGQVEFGQKLPEKIKGVNLKKVISDKLENMPEEEESIKRLLTNVSDEYAPAIDKARRGKIKLEEIRKMADKLGMTSENLLKRQKGEAFSAEKLVRANDIMTTSAERIVRLQKKLKTKGFGLTTDKDIAEMNYEIQKHAAIQAEFSGARAEAGRALAALRIISKSLGEKNYDAILAETGGREVNRNVLEKILSIDPENETALNISIRDMTKPNFSDKINEYWINSILSAPTTHIVNITSNAITSLSKPLIETPIAALLESPKALLGKKRNVYFRQIPAELVGMAQGTKDGVRSALKAFATEQPQFNSTSKIDALRMRSIPGKLGKVIRTPGQALLASDEFFKHIAYNASINSQAYKRARDTGLSGKKLMEQYAQLKMEPTDQMMGAAIKEADMRTFTNPLGKFGNKIMQLRSDFVVDGKRIVNPMKYILPFIKTPTNIAKYAIERTPVGFVSKLEKIRKGEITGDKISEELAKPIAGSAIMASAMALTQEGLITGAGPKEKNKRDALYRTGWQPYSIKIGDKYYSYARLEPFGSLFGLAADFASLKGGDIKKGEVAERIAYSIGNNITSKTYMRGLSDAMEAINDPGRHAKRYLQNFAGSFIPNVVGATTRATDAEIKRMDNLVDVYKSRFPGLSEHLYPKRDIWGEPIERSGNFWTRFVSPVQYSAAKGSFVDKELLDIGANIGVPNDRVYLSNKLQTKHGITDKSIKMSPEEYDNFQKAIGWKVKLKVEKIMRSDIYKNMSDYDKRNKINTIFTDIRSKVRDNLKKKVIDRHKNENK